MRNSRGIAGDLPAAAVAMDCGSVAGAGPAQPQPRRLQPEHIVSRDIGKHLISGPEACQGPKRRRRYGVRIPFVSVRLPDRKEALGLSFLGLGLENVRGACRRRGLVRPAYSAALSHAPIHIGAVAFRSKTTSPAAVANKVWSVPMPTLRPGWNFVPRWRTRMLPPSTCSPPNFFTPRRRPAGIAAVARRTACLLVSHCLRSETLLATRPSRRRPNLNSL